MSQQRKEWLRSAMSSSSRETRKQNKLTQPESQTRKTPQSGSEPFLLKGFLCPRHPCKRKGKLRWSFYSFFSRVQVMPLRPDTVDIFEIKLKQASWGSIHFNVKTSCAHYKSHYEMTSVVGPDLAVRQHHLSHASHFKGAFL